MKIEMQKSTKNAIFACTIVVILAVACVVLLSFLIEDKVKSEYSQKLADTEQMLNSKKRITLVADIEIKAGEKISEANCSVCNVASDMDAALFSDDTDYGRRALVNIPAGSDVVKAMLGDELVEDGMRSVEYSFVYTGHLHEGEYADIRILYPDGTDYIILSKKCIESVDEEGRIVLYVTEDELLRMDSAVVDAWIYSADDYTVNKDDGNYKPSQMARIYATGYIQPTIQTASEAFYTPSLQVIDEMQNNPNIVAEAADALSDVVRKEMEERMFKYINEDTLTIIEDKSENGSVYTEWEQYYNSTQEDDELSKYYNVSGNGGF